MLKVKKRKRRPTNENEFIIFAFGYMVYYFDYSLIFPICTLIHAGIR